MPTYIVECHGDVRELYAVEADSPEDAMARWAEGDHVLSETMGVDPVSATLDDA